MDIGLAQDVAEKALGNAGAYSDVIFQRRTITQIRFEDGRVDDISMGLDSGAGVRVIRGDLAAYAHTDLVDRDNLTRAALAAREALKHASGGTALNVQVPERKGRSQPVCRPGEGSAEIRQLADHLSACDESARSLGKEIRQVTAVHMGYREEELLVNSLGEVRRGTCQRTRLIVQVVASRNGVIQVGQEAPGSLSGPDFYRSTDPAEVAERAARRALTMLDARPAPTGRMPVVLNSGTGGVLLHEACGHGFEVDHVHKGASVYAGKIGERVANTVVSAADDPTIPALWGSYDFDDEGTPSGETVLIEEGILKGYLYGRHEAMKEGRESTGNGRRQSFRFSPVPRMSNTYIKPGETVPEDIIASTQRGLYARKMGGGQVDPVTGDYVFSVSEGYLIENGKLGPAARGAVLIGNGPRTLEMIDAVGND
ncbi:MAG: TldD/PmbA family protein, partial [Actinobacteria bacterium]|nr:TldD/PmbA family protein [Actinomycetota bacterium]